MSSWADLIASERAAYQGAPLSQLRAVRLALSLHSWGNSPRERARLEAVEALIHDRLRARRAAKRTAQGARS